ncbi:uncharacterized protein LAJ45_03834 [Morchella importuna]|nr:uncharacterized protein LAJ45_03834 [Morchella importuna]KAH8151841.1 hypothetical protein LAJ45_03834 [Morchella importuna]
MLENQPPHKKRRLTRTGTSLHIYCYPEDDHRTDAAANKMAANGPAMAASLGSEPMDTDIVDEVLPTVKVPSVATAAYGDYIESLPINVLFQARIQASPAVRTMYPQALIGESIRLWYPDYKCFNGVLHDGIVPRLGVHRDAVNSLRIVARKGGELVWEGSFACFENQWEEALGELRKNGVGRRVEGGLGSADSVRLLVGLYCPASD